jgi:hypothetical protein
MRRLSKLKPATIATMLALGLGGCGIMPNYSNGFRVGEIQKASRKGIIWKSFEGELVMGGLKSRTTARAGELGATVRSTTTTVWPFSARDAKIMDELQAAANEGVTVKLHYTQWFWAPWSQNTEYTVTRVERVTQ